MEFRKIVEQGVALQSQLPWLEMVAVGGTAASLHAEHRFSARVDHFTTLLKSDFDVVNAILEEWDGWKTKRINKPVLILGERHGVELGIRQQTRTVPLVSEQIDGLWIPTADEALRIKAFLCTKRRALRDFVDVAALADHVGQDRAVEAVSFLNLVYSPQGNQTPITLFSSIAHTTPIDHGDIALTDYKGIRPPYDQWKHVEKVCQRLGTRLAERELNRSLPADLTRPFYRNQGNRPTYEPRTRNR
jgi:hypothetical protein